MNCVEIRILISMLFLHINPFHIQKFWFLVPLLNDLWRSRFVRRILLQDLVSIFSTVLEWLYSFLFDFCSRKDFTNLDALLTSSFSDDLKFQSTERCFFIFWIIIKKQRVFKLFFYAVCWMRWGDVFVMSSF